MRCERSILAVMLAAVAALAPQSRAQTSEDQVKATFLYRFVSFVSWPDGVFADAQAPIRLCVIGAAPFADVLTRTTTGQRVAGRAFEVRRLSDIASVNECHAVYAVGDRADAVLRATHDAPVLTVTDGALGYSVTRGMVHFVNVDDRVRFHIDDARAAESRLLIDPRLLSLALSVRRRAS